jgi:pimeloyl-ACP methyl ester carboxylesterase
MGAARGPVLLALHGAMGGYDQGLILGRALDPPGYRIVAPSRPGYLGTPLSTGRTPAEQADAHAALLDALSIDRADVAAVSGGGPSAIEFAVRHPDRCRSLVLISACGGILTTPLPAAFHVIKALARIPGLAGWVRKVRTRDPDRAASRGIPDPALRARTLADPIAGPLYRELQATTYHRLSARLPGTEHDIRVTRVTIYPLEAIRVPTLIVHGTHDRIVPFAEHARMMTDRIPGAELMTIEAGEHVCLFTHHTAISARVRRFLDRHPAR